jgi:hypothetical protein
MRPATTSVRAWDEVDAALTSLCAGQTKPCNPERGSLADIEDVQREIKSVGDSVKSLQDNTCGCRLDR